MEKEIINLDEDFNQEIEEAFKKENPNYTEDEEE